MLLLENITYSPENDRKVKILKEINLQLEFGKMYALTGPNGGGKSTLARVIMGIYTPATGRILLEGEDITGLSVTERALRGFGYAFQTPVLRAESGQPPGDCLKTALRWNVSRCGRLALPRRIFTKALDDSLSGERLNALRLPRFWPRIPGSGSLMNRRPGLICGALVAW